MLDHLQGKCWRSSHRHIYIHWILYEEPGHCHEKVFHHHHRRTHDKNPRHISHKPAGGPGTKTISTLFTIPLWFSENCDVLFKKMVVTQSGVYMCQKTMIPLRYSHFHTRKWIWKCRLQNGGHFVSASICCYYCVCIIIDILVQWEWS